MANQYHQQGKNISAKSKRSTGDRRWTLLFIGDHGSVITLKRFKAMVLATTIIFLAAVGAVVGLILQNQNTLKENKGLLTNLENSQKRIETLRHEKEILMARLVLAESKVKESLSGNQESHTEKKLVNRTEQKSPAKSGTKLAEVKKNFSLVTDPSRPKPTTHSTAPILSVVIEKFSVSREAGTQSLSAQFKLKNTSPDSQPVAGRAVVVLKGAELQQDKWLAMPSVGLIEGKPSGKKGNSFAIRWFRNMKFTTKAPIYSDQFQTAAVFIFTRSGQLLLEETFPIKIPSLTVLAPETQSIDIILKSLKSTPPAQ